MMLHSLVPVPLVAMLALTGCNLITGMDATFTFDADRGGGGALDAGADGDAAEGACDGGPCSLPVGLALTGPTLLELQGNVTPDPPFADACPEGQVVTGFIGALEVGSLIVHGQLEAQCGHLALSEAAALEITTTPGEVTPQEGVNGTVLWHMFCPTNQVVVGLNGRSGSRLDYFAMDCAPLVVTGAPGAYAIAVGTVIANPGQGGPGGNEFPDTRCGEQQVANQVRGIAAGSINAIGLGCVTVSLTY